MAAEDWFPTGLLDDFDMPSIARCRYCGAWCEWHPTPEGWRLVTMEKGKTHRCRARAAAKPDEFTDLDE